MDWTRERHGFRAMARKTAKRRVRKRRPKRKYPKGQKEPLRRADALQFLEHLRHAELIPEAEELIKTMNLLLDKGFVSVECAEEEAHRHRGRDVEDKSAPANQGRHRRQEADTRGVAREEEGHHGARGGPHAEEDLRERHRGDAIGGKAKQDARWHGIPRAAPRVSPG